MKLYTATYNDGNTYQNPYCEIPVPLPDMPPEHEMYNYGIPKEDQVWKRVDVPKDYRTWQWQRKKQWADEMWHRRLNGEWWLINGNPVYLTGAAFVYFNFWYYGNKALPTFKMQCVWWFDVMKMVERDSDCFGCIEVKPRRAHSTEMALCWGWEVITRYRDSKFGIMSKGDDDAELAFDRLVFSAMKMHHVFKPKNTGSDRPQAQLEYQYPSRKIGVNNVNEVVDDERTPELHSKAWFEPTVEGKFDGEKLRAALFDEIGKIPVSKMDVTYQWNILRECLSQDVGTQIIGKAILPSTIEDMDDGYSIEIVQKFWDTSDPRHRDAAGRTISGCFRMFRSYWIVAPVDKYGYPMAEEARRVRNARLDAFEEAGLLDDAADFRRKYPETIEEALAPPANEASMPTELIDRQLRYLEQQGAQLSQRAVRGNFEWTAGFGSDVKWTPDPNGRFAVSRHPEKPNNRITLQNGHPAPGNTTEFAGGVDPVDATKPKKGGSDCAIAIGMMMNIGIDLDMNFDDNDILLTEGMVSDACVCDYVHRPFRPEEFYEDGIMSAMYFGCQLLVEYNKPGFVNWGHEKGLGAYFAKKPANADTKWMRKTAQEEIGVTATTPTIDNYYRLLRSHIVRRWKNYTHIRLLSDLRKLTATNRTERDLSVAWGWALTLMSGMAIRNRKKRGPKVEGNPRRGLPITTYPTRPI